MRSSVDAFKCIVACVLLIAAAPPLSHAQFAAAQLQDLRTQLSASHKAGDWRANLAAAKKQQELLNSSPDSLLEVARAEAQLGNVEAALHDLKQFVDMGQSTDLLAESADFAPILKSPAATSISAGMKANRAPVSRATTAFQLRDAGLLTEDMDYDPTSQRFFITSVREKKIVRVEANGASDDFAVAPDNWPMMAIKVDVPHRLLWATEVAVQGFDLVRKEDWGKSAVLCYDLATGKLERRIEGPPGSALGDMALLPNGDVIVSDGDGGGVYRIPAQTTKLERLDRGDFISAQTPAVDPDGKHIFVPDYLRGIGVLEIATGQVRWLPMQGRFALNGIDGLYFDHGKLIATQNGTSPERVIVFTLNGTLTRIEAETTIERATATLGDPTHGVVKDGAFYYIANSGWDLMDEHGNVKPGATPSVARIMQTELQTQ